MMGQPGSKPTTAPFENYQVYTGQAIQAAGSAMQGPGMPPQGMYINNDFNAPSQLGYAGPVRPGRQQMYRAQPRGPQMPPQGFEPMSGDDGMDFFRDDDNMSGMQGMGRRPRQMYDPMDPRINPQGGGGGTARRMIDDVREDTQQRMVQSRAPNYRSRPPPQQQDVQPRMMRYRTVVDEPAGYVPPTQAGQYYSVPPVAQQATAQPQQAVTPQQVTLYYDPQTGAIQNPNQTTQYGMQQAAPAQQQPMYLSYPQPAAQPTAYQQAAPAAAAPGYQFATMPQGYMMPQYGMQQQPLVIPAQVFSK